MKILILFAHPAFQKSHVNIHLVDGLESIEAVTFHDLYEHYPELDINVKWEQELLLQHDCIIFHHPMFWFNMPAILKEWQDLVLEHGWAYGSKGDALQGKLFFNVITTGGPKKAFQPSGMHKHTIQELLAPVSLTAKYCGMICLPPFVIHGTFSIEKSEILKYKESYHKLLHCIIDDKFDIEKGMELDYLNNYLIKEEA